MVVSGATLTAMAELGADPATGGTIQLKDGRFGPYVTDGETNASLRKGDTVDALTPERAAELLADRRGAGPSKKKAGAKKAGAKKAGAKKAPAKKAATKKAAATKAATTRTKTTTTTEEEVEL